MPEDKGGFEGSYGGHVRLPATRRRGKGQMGTASMLHAALKKT